MVIADYNNDSSGYGSNKVKEALLTEVLRQLSRAYRHSKPRKTV